MAQDTYQKKKVKKKKQYIDEEKQSCTKKKNKVNQRQTNRKINSVSRLGCHDITIERNSYLCISAIVNMMMWI